MWNFYEKLLTMVHKWFKLRIRGSKKRLKIAVCGIGAVGSIPVRPAIHVFNKSITYPVEEAPL